MINEGIEQTTVQFAAERRPLETKKYLKNHLLTHGIKVAEDETMKRRSKGIMSRESTYDIDFFDGVTFYVHNNPDINVQIKGNKVIVKTGNDSFTTSLGNITTKELGNFIIESYKKSKTPQTSFSTNTNTDKNITTKLDDELGEKYTVHRKNLHAGELSPDFVLHVNVHKFDLTREKDHDRILTIIRKLLNDPVVKRSLTDKDIGERRLNYHTTFYKVLPQIRDEVFEAVEKFVNRIYEQGIDIADAGVEHGKIYLSRPRKNRFGSDKPLERRKKPKLLDRKEVIRRIKKELIRASSYRNEEFKEYSKRLEEVAHSALKRFFKEPEKYI